MKLRGDDAEARAPGSAVHCKVDVCDGGVDVVDGEHRIERRAGADVEGQQEADGGGG